MRKKMTGKTESDLHPTRTLDKSLTLAIRQAAKEGELPCQAAFSISNTLSLSPREVGAAADALGVRLVRCQLGLFGYKPEKRIITASEAIPEDLRRAIEKGLENRKLPCQEAWEIALRLGLTKMEVASACEGLRIKIGPCQLGAF